MNLQQIYAEGEALQQELNHVQNARKIRTYLEKSANEAWLKGYMTQSEARIQVIKSYMDRGWLYRWFVEHRENQFSGLSNDSLLGALRAGMSWEEIKEMEYDVWNDAMADITRDEIESQMVYRGK